MNGPCAAILKTTMPLASQSAAGLLRRKCACGTNTMAGSTCDECAKAPMLSRLTVGAADDPLEDEADRIAQRIMAAPAAPAAPVGGRSAPRVQRLATTSRGRSLAAPATVDRALAVPGRPLDRPLRQEMETRFGYEFSGVRVHSGAEAEQSARYVAARAYTVGQHIVFAAGQFAPQTPRGLHLLAHELTHVVQQTGLRRCAAAEPVPIRAASAQNVVSRACNAAPCPAVEFPIGAFVPSWQLAEGCLQDHYQKSFPNSTVGFNKHWAGLIGKNPREEATIDCFRSHYTAKGFSPKGKKDISVDRQGAMQPQAEPDIFDFTNLKIMEVTTPAGVAYRAKKIIWEVDLATDLMHECQIGAPNQWAPGFWVPEPCHQIVGAGATRAGKLFFRTWQVGGILVYTPVLDVTREAAALATVAAAAAAAAAKSAGPGGSGAKTGPEPRWGVEIGEKAAAVIAALAALAALLALVFKPLRLATLLGQLLGWLLQRLGLGLLLKMLLESATVHAASSSKGDGATPGGRQTPGDANRPAKPKQPADGGTHKAPVDVPTPGQTAGGAKGQGATSTIPVPGAPPVTIAIPGATPPPAAHPASGAAAPPAHGKPAASKTPTTRRSSSRPSASAPAASGPGRTIDLASIEGLNLHAVTPGMFVYVRIPQGKAIDSFNLWRVASTRPVGTSITVEFDAVEECDIDTGCVWTGNRYRVTAPYRDTGKVTLSAYADPNRRYPEWVLGHLRRTAQELDDLGRPAEAQKVRQEIERLTQLGRPSPGRPL